MNRPALEDLHRAAGATLSASEPPVLLTYGDVPAEYRAARQDCALFDRSDRGRIEVRGPEAAAFLHRLLANTVRTLAPGQGNRNLLLSSKGKVLYDFDLDCDEEAFLLSTPPGVAGGLLAALEQYHFSEKLSLSDDSERHAPLALIGPRRAEVLRKALSIDPPPEPPPGEHKSVRARMGSAEVQVTALPVAGAPGLRVDAGPEQAQHLWSLLREAGARPAGRVAWDILRVEAGVAEPGIDLDENVYPQEARLESAFSLDKGCYVGQEVVAKIDTYGGLNKRITRLRISHDDPVPRSTRLYRLLDGEWRDLGVVTSWAYSFELDSGLVLAYVKRRHQDPGTEFRVGEGPASAQVVELPVRHASTEA